ncbi:MAG: dihydropteroate synthase [Myxococcales bacterium FL481]|nr:MAG: dihydropteroate synthase [Myxococcales bacterium FL481]
MEQQSPTPGLFGIVNVTEDSFSDGGRYLDPQRAIAQARALVEAGAKVIDLGPASSHPAARHVGPEEEIRRLAPVIDVLANEGVTLSVDSYEVETQRYALSRGVAYLNDVAGFPAPSLYPELARSDAQLVVMHSVQGEGPATVVETVADTIWRRVLAFFDQRIEALGQAGVGRERLILDPGMGLFLGRDPEVSLRVLANIDRLRDHFALPVMVSVSRKSFLRVLTGRGLAEVGAATLAAELAAAEFGVDWIRTHDVAAVADGWRVMSAIRRARGLD